MKTLPVELDRSAPEPLGIQLSSRVRDLITHGTLAVGDRLPSTRALAGELGVARSVTEQAYDQLLAEGWLTTRQGAGTYVATGGTDEVATRARRRRTTAPELVTLDLGSPWIDPRHAAGWRRAWRDVSAARPPAGYDDHRGLADLRLALADRLARTRGLTVDPDEILMTAGTTDGLRQLLPHLAPGAVAVDDPGYSAAVACVRAAGRAVVDHRPGAPYPMADLAAAYLTPAHQHPLGHVMPAAERVALLEEAHAHDTLLIEDDYDSEFRYDVAPIPALAALDRSRVAYLGTASKSAGPGLRVGWLVAPPELHGALLAHREKTFDVPAWPAQRALLSLIREGWLDKVVRTARRVYADRATRVAEALSPYGELAGPAAGMYSTWFLPAAAAQRAHLAARAAGFDVAPLSRYCRTSRRSGLVIGFGAVSDEQLDTALAALVTALGQPNG